MSKVFLDKIHAIAEAKAEAEGLNVKAIDFNNRESRVRWYIIFFTAANELRDELQSSGLLNSVKAVDHLISQHRKTINDPEDRILLERALNLHELNDAI